MNRTRSLAALLVAGSLVVAACGGDDATGDQSDDSSVEEPAPATPQPSPETASGADEPSEEPSPTTAPSADTTVTESTDPSEPTSAVETKTAGLVVLAPVVSLEQAADGFKDSAAECTTVNIEVDERNAEGDIASLTSITEAFVANGVDFIAPISTPAAQAALQVVGGSGGSIPVAYSVVTDPFAAGLAVDPSTHEPWITGSQSLPPFGAVIDIAQLVVPDLQTIGMPYAPSEANSQPVIDAIQAIADERGLTLETASATTSAEVGQAAEALAGRGVDVFIVPTISTVDSGQAAIAQVGADNDIPVIGSASAQATASAAVAVGADYYAAGVRAGEIACAVLSGEATPADFDVENIEDVAIAVNETFAEQQGVTIPDELLADAEIVG